MVRTNKCKCRDNGRFQIFCLAQTLKYQGNFRFLKLVLRLRSKNSIFGYCFFPPFYYLKLLSTVTIQKTVYTFLYVLSGSGKCYRSLFRCAVTEKTLFFLYICHCVYRFHLKDVLYEHGMR